MSQTEKVKAPTTYKPPATRDIESIVGCLEKGVDPASSIREAIHSIQSKPNQLATTTVYKFLRSLQIMEGFKLKTEAKSVIENSAYEFMQMLLSECAENAAIRTGNTTSANELIGEDILNALSALGFIDYLELAEKAMINARKERLILEAQRKRKKELKLAEQEAAKRQKLEMRAMLVTQQNNILNSNMFRHQQGNIQNGSVIAGQIGNVNVKGNIYAKESISCELFNNPNNMNNNKNDSNNNNDSNNKNDNDNDMNIMLHNGITSDDNQNNQNNQNDNNNNNTKKKKIQQQEIQSKSKIIMEQKPKDDNNKIIT